MTSACSAGSETVPWRMPSPVWSSYFSPASRCSFWRRSFSLVSSAELALRLACEDERGVRSEEHESDLLQGRRATAMSQHLFDHDPCALLERKAGDPGAHRGKGNRPQTAQVGDLKAAASR